MFSQHSKELYPSVHQRQDVKSRNGRKRWNYTLALAYILPIAMNIYFYFIMEARAAPSIPPHLNQPVAELAADVFVRRSMEYYFRVANDRYKWLREGYGGDLASVIPFDGVKESYLWDFFPPAFNCPFRERIGRFSEGGKVVCNWQALAAKCKQSGVSGESAIVYSFGVRGDVSFELELIELTGCDIWAFDPTVPGVPIKNNRLHFSREGLGHNDNDTLDGYPLRTLSTLMKMRGITQLTFLRLIAKVANGRPSNK